MTLPYEHRGPRRTVGKKNNCKIPVMTKTIQNPSVKTHWNESHNTGVQSLANSPSDLNIIEPFRVRTHLEALLFTPFALLVVGVLAPVSVAIRVVREKRIVRLARCFYVTLQNRTGVQASSFGRNNVSTARALISWPLPLHTKFQFLMLHKAIKISICYHHNLHKTK